MAAWDFLQHGPHFRHSRSHSSCSSKIICLLGLLWTLVFSLSISLGVRPDANQVGKTLLVQSRGWRYPTEAILWLVVGIPGMSGPAAWQTCTLNRIKDEVVSLWDSTVIATPVLKLNCKTFSYRENYCTVKERLPGGRKSASQAKQIAGLLQSFCVIWGKPWSCPVLLNQHFMSYGAEFIHTCKAAWIYCSKAVLCQHAKS